MNDLISVFNSFGEVLPLATRVVFVFIGLAGLFFGLTALYDAYRYGVGEISSDLPSKGSIPLRLLLAGAMTVAPLLLWRAANTFVLGGDETADLFSYTGTVETLPYCEAFHTTLAFFFMFVGAIAMATGAVQWYGVAKGQSSRGYAGPVVFLIGGLLCFFVDDVALIIGNTIGMDVSLTNICTNMGAGASS